MEQLYSKERQFCKEFQSDAAMLKVHIYMHLQCSKMFRNQAPVYCEAKCKTISHLHANKGSFLQI